ncbi:MAG: ribonuclease E/G [Lachnospiraceae bacterium]|nr:ribonuclease E/G [Lachnospiraceae bacterium]
MVRVIVTKYRNQILLAVRDEEDFQSLYLCEKGSVIGKIYLGRVEKQVKNIGSSFVRLSKEEYGFLDGEEKAGTILPVQIVREGKGEKKHSVSRKLSLPGRYCVVLYGNKPEGKLLFSGKLTEEARAALKESFDRLSEGDKLCYDVLLRTNAAEVEFCEVFKEYQKLSDKMDSILKNKDTRTEYSLLYEPPGDLLRELSRIELSSISEIITDLPEEYERIKREYYEELPEKIRERIRLTFYQDPLLSLFHLVSLETALKRAVDKRVWLKSGGCLVIEQTEALVAIDVNSAKLDKKQDKEEATLLINLEAAREAARQLRLRNLSGIIIIDFINMKREENRKRLIEELKEAVNRDSIRTSFEDMTKLGLVELTRKREGRTLREMLKDNLNTDGGEFIV